MIADVIRGVCIAVALMALGLEARELAFWVADISLVIAFQTVNRP